MAIQGSLNALIASIVGAKKLAGKFEDGNAPVLPKQEPGLKTEAQKGVPQSEIVAKQSEVVSNKAISKTLLGGSTGFNMRIDPQMYNQVAMYSMASNGMAQYNQKKQFENHKARIYNKRKLSGGSK